jgi:hypothetical protein
MLLRRHCISRQACSHPTEGTWQVAHDGIIGLPATMKWERFGIRSSDVDPIRAMR